MTKEYTINVQSNESAQRLDTFLTENGMFKSRSQVQNIIKKNQVTVNGNCVKSSYMLKNGDVVKIVLSEDSSVIILPENIELDIVYEDDDILVVNKPKNMLTHPTAKETEGTLVNALLYRYGYEGLSDLNGILRPGIVHRLDRNTSGLLMVAKNNVAHEFLTEQIKSKTAKRQYLAVVHGNFEQKEGIVDAPIGRNPNKPEKMAVVEDGKPSVTMYKVLEEFKGYSFVELTLKTGRTHQIRVHMTSIGHSIVNDSLYNKIPFKVKTTEQVLQAYKLQFTTVKNNGIIELEIKQDDDLQKVLKYLRSKE